MTDAEYIDELEREIALEDAAFRVPIHFRRIEARRRLVAGERPCFSTGIHGGLTCGYGLLDQFGYWQYPLPCEETGKPALDDGFWQALVHEEDKMATHVLREWIRSERS